MLVRPLGVPEWLPARVEWSDADVDAALVVIEEEGWRVPAGTRCCAGGSWRTVIRCRARRLGFRGRRCGRTGCGIPRTCTGSWPRWGSCRQGRLDFDVAVRVAVSAGGRLAVGGDVGRGGDRR